jgi:hypothetical protein
MLGLNATQSGGDEHKSGEKKKKMMMKEKEEEHTQGIDESGHGIASALSPNATAQVTIQLLNSHEIKDATKVNRWKKHMEKRREQGQMGNPKGLRYSGPPRDIPVKAPSETNITGSDQVPAHHRVSQFGSLRL